MSHSQKYDNLKAELPKLPEVLANTIQSECLEIRSLQKDCPKYVSACSKIPALSDAVYVVYSPYVEKANHKYEKFIFLDKEGVEVCDVSGVEMELYGILDDCNNLDLTEDYKLSHSNSQSNE